MKSSLINPKIEFIYKERFVYLKIVFINTKIKKIMFINQKMFYKYKISFNKYKYFYKYEIIFYKSKNRIYIQKNVL